MLEHWKMEFSKPYLAAIYTQLDNLVPGNFIDLKAIDTAEKKDKYIAAVKVYIDDHHPEIEFNNNYTKVKKLYIYPHKAKP